MIIIYDETQGRRPGRDGGPAELGALRARWRRWTAVVALFANRHRGRRRVDPRAYGEVHRALTEACRTLAAGGEEHGRDYFRGLEGLVQPWLDTSVLAKADREILVDLLARCRKVEKELGGRVERPAAVRCVVLGLTALATLAAFVLWDPCGNGALSGLLRQVAGWADPLRQVIERSTGGGRLFLTVVVFMPVSPFITSSVAGG
jgi:hypothetical protein